MIHWMDVYRLGMSAKDAQFHVCAHSSKKYKSHQHVPECLACQFEVDYEVSYLISLRNIPYIVIRHKSRKFYLSQF